MIFWFRLSVNSLQRESVIQKDSSDKINRLQGQEFGIYIYHGIYDIPKKGSDHSEQWESEEIYSFGSVVSPVDKDYNAEPKMRLYFPGL